MGDDRTREEKTLGKRILAKPGGVVVDGEPWSAFTPNQCCEKLSGFLNYLLKKGGAGSDTHPFKVPPVEENETMLSTISNAWFSQGSVSTDVLRRFYTTVIGDWKLPFVAKVGGVPVSWFVQSMFQPNVWISVSGMQQRADEEKVATSLLEGVALQTWLNRSQKTQPFPMSPLRPYTMRQKEEQQTVDMLVQLSQHHIDPNLRDTFLKKIIEKWEKRYSPPQVSSEESIQRMYIS